MGFISLQRSIRFHWLWEQPIKLQWWLDLLMEVNHSDKKVMIGNKLVLVKRGQKITSISKTASRWNVTRDTARAFFKLLEREGMIKVESNSKYTQITICNYDTYQQSTHNNSSAKQQVSAQQPSQLNAINNNDKKNNNEINSNSNGRKRPIKELEVRKTEFSSQVLSLVDSNPDYGDKAMIHAFIDYWTEHGANDKKMRFEKQTSFGIKRRLSTWKKNHNEYHKNRSEKAVSRDEEQQLTRTEQAKLSVLKAVAMLDGQ